MQDIDIYNPFRGSEFNRKTNLANSIWRSTADFPDKNQGGIDLKSDTIFGRRQKVHLALEVENYVTERSGITEMSISVAPAGVSSHLHADMEIIKKSQNISKRLRLNTFQKVKDIIFQ